MTRRVFIRTNPSLLLKLGECIGLLSSFENAWVDCFREADFSGVIFGIRYRAFNTRVM